MTCLRGILTAQSASSGEAQRSASLGTAAYLGWSIIDWSKKDSDFNVVNNSDPIPGESTEDFQGRKGDAEKRVNEAADVVNLASIIVGSVWALNLIDATIVGFQEKGRVKTLYFSASPSPEGAQVRLSYRF